MIVTEMKTTQGCALAPGASLSDGFVCNPTCDIARPQSGWSGEPAAYAKVKQKDHPQERWPSGLRRTLGKRVYFNEYRGFESHSLRQPLSDA